ncbi:MAG TPA: peptide chain release factor N(5)-glutamine methyltransferase [Hyphomonas sp.]|nr:peptide chain release factor N(5)-glutamine methyltransferase [Hyphomonas sp.]MCB9972248.1 peptide chain release factor N(5)-glutamine methyltransferase [Hyphomonas sp.]HPE48464.1 peptide chain release factor N(5)-glutamine methyltransferase [Hyphomonas sp.]
MTAPTFDDLIHAATKRFREAGISDARQNAMLLMLDAFGGTHAALISAGTQSVPQPVQEAFDAAVERRLAREPLQHILGNTFFYGLEIRCDSRALVPRADSESVVEAALSLFGEDVSGSVADLGTGTGCLLAAFLDNRPRASGTGVEASPAAASLARENLEALGLSGRASVAEGSWADWSGWEQTDLVISNPPYIARGEIQGLAPEVRDHDPAAALDGGEDGLDAYREIVALAAARMKPSAWLVFEIGYDQKAAVCRLLETAGFSDIGAARDLGGNDRVVWARKPAG